MQTFSWKKLPRPFLCLAPMADVTDAAFRRMFARYGKPDVMFTEFVSADGLMSRGREHLLTHLLYHPSERPVIAQLFGANPEKILAAAQLIQKLGFDGLDINMGCPVKDIEKSGSGAALIKSPALAKELIAAAMQGAGPLPVSVKTRLGYNSNDTETWILYLAKTGVAAITVHARTRHEMSKVPAHWNSIALAKQLLTELPEQSRPVLIGNGDVTSLTEAHQRFTATDCDGIMIGRGAFGSPWFFRSDDRPDIKTVINMLIEHIQLFHDLYHEKKSFEIMKKHFKAYIANYEGAAELRTKLMTIKTAETAITILQNAVFH